MLPQKKSQNPEISKISKLFVHACIFVGMNVHQQFINRCFELAQMAVAEGESAVGSFLRNKAL
ncbi:hypothetical protein ABIE54_004378 [Chitinophagaceae bacterium OAS944]